MPFRCAILGCGPRSEGHAEAYQHVTRGTLVAACSRDPARLHVFGDRFGIAARYHDVATMLREQQPDMVHIVIAPTSRVEVLRAAAEHGVRGAIVEKPVAVQGEDYRALQQLAAVTPVKICINHQLHFHPRRLALARAIRAGAIGEVRFVEASARMNLAYQGTHLLELICAHYDGARPVEVFGQAAGAEGLAGRRGHFAPDQCLASLRFDNGRDALLRCGTNAPEVLPERVSQHKRAAIYGTGGLAAWTMHGWELGRDAGGVERGTHVYAEQDILGQAGLTEAMFDWLEDDARVHPTNLAGSLVQFNAILGLYLSVLEHRPMSLPVEPAPDLIARLRAALGAGEA